MHTIEQFRASKREISNGSNDMPEDAKDMIGSDAAVRSVYVYTGGTWIAQRHDGRLHMFLQYDEFCDSLEDAEAKLYGWHMQNSEGSDGYLPMLEFMANDALPLNDADWGSDRQITAENRFFEHAHAICPLIITEAFDMWCLEATCDEYITAAIERIKEAEHNEAMGYI
jgi:hypothetical protein